MAAYTLIRTLPNGQVKAHSPAPTKRAAAEAAGWCVHDNAGTAKADAQQLSAALLTATIGETVKHEPSGYSFRIQEETAATNDFPSRTLIRRSKLRDQDQTLTLGVVLNEGWRDWSITAQIHATATGELVRERVFAATRDRDQVPALMDEQERKLRAAGWQTPATVQLGEGDLRALLRELAASHLLDVADTDDAVARAWDALSRAATAARAS